MTDSYVDWRKNQNIKPIVLPNKVKFYSDLINIEHSWSGRMDTNICNTFIMEAEQQLVNAIEMFEFGYFDCAYHIAIQGYGYLHRDLRFLHERRKKEGIRI